MFYVPFFSGRIVPGSVALFTEGGKYLEGRYASATRRVREVFKGT